jgi:hypothetical protein
MLDQKEIKMNDAMFRRRGRGEYFRKLRGEKVEKITRPEKHEDCSICMFKYKSCLICTFKDYLEHAKDHSLLTGHQNINRSKRRLAKNGAIAIPLSPINKYEKKKQKKCLIEIEKQLKKE